MAKIFSGTYVCPKHGEFEWKGYILEGDSIFGKISDMVLNCGGIYQEGNKYHISVICPYCGIRYSIQKEIE